ncbi:ATPase domain protein [Mycobacterium kansasii 732]|nr:ATPase domain protein [Mycobacterium kansasii 732]
MPVDGGEWNANLRSGVGVAVDDDGAQFQRLACHGVTGRDPLRGPARPVGHRFGAHRATTSPSLPVLLGEAITLLARVLRLRPRRWAYS